MNTTTIVGTYAITDSFDFRLDLVDKFNTTLSLNVLSTAEVTMSWGKSGIGVGKVWEQGALDVGGNISLDGAVLLSRKGMNSIYDSLKTSQIWSMGTQFNVDTVANTQGTLYGMSYSHSNAGTANYKIDGQHQINFVNNGTIGASIGLNGQSYFASTMALDGNLIIRNNYGVEGKSTTGSIYNIGYVDSTNKVVIGTTVLPLQLNSSTNPNFNIAGTSREAWHDGNCTTGGTDTARWIKYANGTMITLQQVNLGIVAVDNAWGSAGFTSGSLVMPNYPQAFVELPTVSIYCFNTFGACFAGMNHGGGDGTISKPPGVDLWRASSATLTGVIIHMQAVGRWK